MATQATQYPTLAMLLGDGARALFLRHWPLWVGLMAFLLPLAVDLGSNIWTTEQGSHGPLIAGTGIWLLIHEARHLEIVPRPGKQALWSLALVIGLLIYLVSTVGGMIPSRGIGAWITVVALIYRSGSGDVVRKLAFPLIYLLAMIPPPGLILEFSTRALKLWISDNVTNLLAEFGYAVATSGPMIYIDQYELKVADACAGLNSMFSLVAIGVLLIYLLHRAQLRYAFVLTLLLIPIAIFANFVRVLLLVLSTKYFGEAFAQGVFHEMAGLVTFGCTIICLIFIDKLLDPLRRKLEGANR